MKPGVIKLLEKMGMAEAIYFRHRRKKMLTAEYILSNEYEALMKKNADADSYDRYIDDAENSTENYQFRHHPFLQKQLGSWRWKAMYQYRKELAPIIFNKKLTGIDLGGAYGPVAQHTVIVDFEKSDIFGREVKYRTLNEIDFQADYLFSSHTLEHIQDLDELARQIRRILKPGGIIISLVPSYSCISWRVGNHTNKFHNDHVWTFYLSGTPISEPINNLLAIDQFMEKYFTLTLKKYTGDNSILLMART
jgi:SAM-dependent methyltransferase